MKTLPYVDFVDYNQHILQSFGKNARGFAFDPKFSSNYDSANLFAVIRVVFIVNIEKTILVWSYPSKRYEFERKHSMVQFLS